MVQCIIWEKEKTFEHDLKIMSRGDVRGAEWVDGRKWIDTLTAQKSQ